MHAIKSHVITQDQLHVHLRTAEQSQPMEHDTSSFLLQGGGWWFSRYVLFDSLVTPWTAARQAPLSMGFSRQEHLNGLPCAPSGCLPDPGIRSSSAALQVGLLPRKRILHY